METCVGSIVLGIFLWTDDDQKTLEVFWETSFIEYSSELALCEIVTSRTS